MSAAAPVRATDWRGTLRRWRHSLRWRLVALFVLFAVTSTAVFVYGMRELMHSSWHDYGRPLVVNYVDMLVHEIGNPPDLDKAAALTQRLPIAIRIEGPGLHWSSENEPGRPWMVQRDLPGGQKIWIGLASEPPGLMPHAAGRLMLAILLLLTLAAYAYVHWLFRPLDAIRQGTLRFGRGDFSHRIETRRHDELGDLADNVNTMAGEIAQMLDAKRTLLMAISHELRSPITRARVHAELMDEGDTRSALLRDLGQMRDLIDDLLESERLAAGHASLLREPVDLAALVAQLRENDFPGRAIDIEIEPGLPPQSLDRARLRLMLRNLVGNALRHGQCERPPQVRIRREGEGLRITVRDFGPGVPDDVLPQLATAFHRADPARQRATGGVGLGLYLSRLVVEAHGGRWQLRNAAPGLEISAWLAAG